MNVRLVESDRWGPRPLPHLRWGIMSFVCVLCGRPVVIVGAGPLTGGPCEAALPVRSDCQRAAGPELTDRAMRAAAAQKAWELRAVLN